MVVPFRRARAKVSKHSDGKTAHGKRLQAMRACCRGLDWTIDGQTWGVGRGPSADGCLCADRVYRLHSSKSFVNLVDSSCWVGLRVSYTKPSIPIITLIHHWAFWATFISAPKCAFPHILHTGPSPNSHNLFESVIHGFPSISLTTLPHLSHISLAPLWSLCSSSFLPVLHGLATTFGSCANAS